jgi:hypothetical protein
MAKWSAPVLISKFHEKRKHLENTKSQYQEDMVVAAEEQTEQDGQIGILLEHNVDPEDIIDMWLDNEMDAEDKDEAEKFVAEKKR